MCTKNTESYKKHLFDCDGYDAYTSDVLNLGIGSPGIDIFDNCSKIFEKASLHRLQWERTSNSSLLFQYGPPGGTYGVRSALAKFLTKMYADTVKSEDLFITGGASHGLHFILSTLVDLKGYIFVDEITFWIALGTMKQFNTLTIVPIKMNDDGVDLQDFERALKAHKFKPQSKEFWGVYYAMPTYHNPTGIVFTDSICKKLIKLAREYDILISCDDVYNVLNYTDVPAPKRLFAYDDSAHCDYRGNVISNCSFSKIIAPGIRMGWLEAPGRLLPILENSGVSISSGCFNNYTAGLVESLLELGLLQEHTNMILSKFRERMDATCETLVKHLPPGCSLLRPQGGYFIWIRLPVAVDADEFLKMCLDEERIYFTPGSTFSLTGRHKHCLRITIAFYSTERLVDGALRMCAALQRFLKI